MIDEPTRRLPPHLCSWWHNTLTRHTQQCSCSGMREWTHSLFWYVVTMIIEAYLVRLLVT